MVYSTTVQGVPFTSNVDPGATPAAGHFVYTVNFSIPFVNILAQYGIDLVEIFDRNFIAQVTGQSGSNVTNLSITPIGNNLVIAFDAGSPVPVIVAAVIVALIAIPFIIAGIGLFFTQGGQFFLTASSIGIIAIAAIGGGILIYGLLKSPEARRNVVRGVEHGTAYLASV